MKFAATTRFATIPEWVLFADVSCNAKMLYCVLDRAIGERGGWSVSRGLLAERMGKSADTVDRARAELRALGALVETARVDDDGQQANHYMLRRDDPNPAVESAPLPTPLGTGADGPLGTGAERKEGQTLERTSKDMSPDGDDLGFDEFWDIYPPMPNGRKPEKAKARKQWRSLSLEERRRAFRGARALAADVREGLTLPKHPFRFLRMSEGEFPFDDWQTVSAVVSPWAGLCLACGHPEDSGLHERACA